MRDKNLIHSVVFTKHAEDKWIKTAYLLGINPSKKAMRKALSKATPEIITNQMTNFNLFKRSIMHGETRYLVFDGWRFVLQNNICITIERVNPHENFKYLKNFRKEDKHGISNNK